MGSTCCKISHPGYLPQITIVDCTENYAVPKSRGKKARRVISIGSPMNLPSEASGGKVLNRDKLVPEYNLILSTLKNHFVFKELSDEHLSLIIQEMKLYALEAHSVIFEQNQPGSNFFVLNTGSLDVRINNQSVKILYPGDSFGELSLLHNTLRSATITTLEKSTLWVLDRDTFRHILENISRESFAENKEFLLAVPMLKILLPSQINALASSMVPLKYGQNENIVNQGDPGEVFYIIRDGKVSCKVNGRIVREMGSGEYFGEQALIHNSFRTATITAVTSVNLLAISREQLSLILGQSLQKVLFRNSLIIALEHSDYMHKLRPEQMDLISSKMTIESFKEDDIVIPKGECDKLWIVIQGSLSNGKEEIGSLQCVGDKQLIQTSSSGFMDDVRAKTDSEVASISFQSIKELFGATMNLVMYRNEICASLKNVNILRQLSMKQLEILAGGIIIQTFSPYEEIVRQGEEGNSLYIIKTGTVNALIDGNLIRSIGSNDYFGERAILHEERRSASIVAMTEVQCFILEKSTFLAVVNENILKLLTKRILYQDQNIALEDLGIVKLIGKGMFGNVFLGVHNSSKIFYAIKTVQKTKVSAYRLHQALLNEKETLMLVDHPMIVKLVKTFKDEFRYYFLMEYIQGMDLFDVLRTMGLLSEKDSKFYYACMILIIEHLHSQNILYRDIKPENVMVDSQGYLKLIDFGASKITRDRTFTIIGTPHYLAPEVITGKGYDHAADYWGLGIMLYEFITGEVPFGESFEDPMNIYQAVLHNELFFPSFLGVSTTCKIMIKQLLTKDPVLRKNGRYKKHPWLRDLNWDDVASRRAEAPYRPEREDPDLDNCLLETKNPKVFIALEEKNTSIYSDSPKRKNSYELDLYF